MATTYNRKTAARLLARATGASYQKALAAVSTGNLDPLLTASDTGPADEMLNLLGVQLVAAGEYPTLSQARRALLTSTLAAVVRRHHPDAVAVTVAFDEEAPVVGYLESALLGEGTELTELFGEAVADEAFVWAHLLCCSLGLDPGQGAQVPLPPA